MNGWPGANNLRAWCLTNVPVFTLEILKYSVAPLCVYCSALGQLGAELGDLRHKPWFGDPGRESFSTYCPSERMAGMLVSHFRKNLF